MNPEAYSLLRRLPSSRDTGRKYIISRSVKHHGLSLEDIEKILTEERK